MYITSVLRPVVSETTKKNTAMEAKPRRQVKSQRLPDFTAAFLSKQSNTY